MSIFNSLSHKEERERAWEAPKSMVSYDSDVIVTCHIFSLRPFAVNVYVSLKSRVSCFPRGLSPDDQVEMAVV